MIVRRGCGWVVLLIVAVLLAIMGWQFLKYRATLDVLPADVSIAGLDVSGMRVDQALAALDGAYAQPVILRYQDEEIMLTPESVAFSFDRDSVQAAVEEVLASRKSLEGFMTYLLRRPPEPVEITPQTTFSVERLNGFLNRVAQEHDQPAQPPVPLPGTLTFRAGLPGYEMDLDASQERAIGALASPTEREADLVINMEEAPPLQISHLEEMLQTLLEDFHGIPSIFVKDLETGEELEINPNVAYAGMSVVKIAIMVETYRVLDEPPNIEQTRLLTKTMTLSGNFTANLLLQEVIGNGDGYQGVETLTGSMQYLGLVNTFMATPYDEEVVPPTIVTPANSRTDLTTHPDPYMQTTARDMGLLLEMIYQCSHNGGALLVAYPGAFTPEECQQMLEIMAQNEVDSLIEEGVPSGTVVAHKHGWISDTHADAAVVFSPGGDFVLVVFLYYPDWLEWEVSNPLVNDISRATYNYFNPYQ